MKAAEVEKGVSYVARRSSYNVRWRVEVIEVKRIEIEPARDFGNGRGIPAKMAQRVLVEIKHNPYEGAEKLGRGPRLDDSDSWKGPNHEVGDQIWIEARYIEQKWDDHVRAEQASKDATALALLEAKRVVALCHDAGLDEFVHAEMAPYGGHARVTMNLSQSQVERLAMSILEMR